MTYWLSSKTIGNIVLAKTAINKIAITFKTKPARTILATFK